MLRSNFLLEVYVFMFYCRLLDYYSYSSFSVVVEDITRRFFSLRESFADNDTSTSSSSFCVTEVCHYTLLSLRYAYSLSDYDCTLDYLIELPLQFYFSSRRVRLICTNPYPVAIVTSQEKEESSYNQLNSLTSSGSPYR